VTRVIAGALGGRRLRTPAGHATRPTSDRVREALFSSLGDAVRGSRVLDLFAGSGALAIEALSRGAAEAALVESDKRAATVVKANLEALGLRSAARVHVMTAEAFCAQPQAAYDVVLLDPPYAMPLPALYALLERLRAAGGLAEGAQVVVERQRRDAHLDAPAPAFLVPERRRTYGDTTLLYFRTEPQ
jgi:16S rRNA (guanine966-N2)-methyltransferase